MTLLEAIGAIVSGLGLLLGSGGLAKISIAWLAARRERAREEAAADKDVAKLAFEFAGSAREDTARHVTDWGECERRCGRLEGELATARAEAAALRARVAELEREVGLMRSAIDALLEGRDPSPRLLSAVTGGRIPRGRP